MLSFIGAINCYFIGLIIVNATKFLVHYTSESVAIFCLLTLDKNILKIFDNLCYRLALFFNWGAVPSGSIFVVLLMLSKNCLYV